MFLRVCQSTSVVLELGLLAFPAGSPLADAGGCRASKTAFTSIKLENLEWQSLPRVPHFPVLAHGCLRINCDKMRRQALCVYSTKTS